MCRLSVEEIQTQVAENPRNAGRIGSESVVSCFRMCKAERFAPNGWGTLVALSWGILTARNGD